MRKQHWLSCGYVIAMHPTIELQEGRVVVAFACEIRPLGASLVTCRHLIGRQVTKTHLLAAGPLGGDLEFSLL